MINGHFKKVSLSLEILTLSILPRIFLIILSLYIFDISFSQYVLARDGCPYINLAVAFANLNFSNISYIDSRLFLGYPAIVGFLGKFIGFGLSGITVSLIATSVSCYLFFLIFKDKTITRYFFFLPPVWFMTSSLVAPESLMLALMLSSLHLFLRNRHRSALALVLFGVVVKPTLLFLFLIYLFLLAKDKFYKDVTFGIFLSIILACFYLVFYQLIFNDMFVNYRAYSASWSYSSNRIFVFPYQDIFRDIFFSRQHFYKVALWRRIYIFLYILFFATGIFFIIKLYRMRHDRLTTVALLWCGTVFLFAGSLGGWSAIHGYDKYTLPALPFLFYSMKDFFPKGKICLSIAFFVSFLYSLIGNMHSFQIFK